jgi:hypothetical protein
MVTDWPSWAPISAMVLMGAGIRSISPPRRRGRRGDLNLACSSRSYRKYRFREKHGSNSKGPKGGKPQEQRPPKHVPAYNFEDQGGEIRSQAEDIKPSKCVAVSNSEEIKHSDEDVKQSCVEDTASRVKKVCKHNVSDTREKNQPRACFI